MIRPLRQLHRRVFAVIGVLLPIAFAWGIAARKPVSSVANLPAEFKATPQPHVGDDWEYTDIFTNVPVRVHLLRDRTTEGRLAVSLSAEKDFAKPDLLAYWLPSYPETTNTLPEDAILLGASSSPVLPLPEQATKSDGVILLYSLADNEIVDISRRTKFIHRTQ
jgi:hypothetical protein